MPCTPQPSIGARVSKGRSHMLQRRIYNILQIALLAGELKEGSGAELPFSDGKSLYLSGLILPTELFELAVATDQPSYLRMNMAAGGQMLKLRSPCPSRTAVSLDSV